MKFIQPARLHWSADNEPVAADFGDVYFSAADGHAETRHVFLHGNRLPERWRTLAEKQFVIGETGFGTGLNFVAAWQLWEATAPAEAHLTFVSAEQFPLARQDLSRAAARWPELKQHYDALLAQYPVLTAGFHLLHFGRVHLLLMLGEATEVFGQLESHVDAWFLDGFAPAKNPELWTAALLQRIAHLSRPGSTLATFSAAGEFRRCLTALGFEVHKQKGFGHKRDMTVATAVEPARMSPTTTPWHRPDTPLSAPRRVTIVGAGIAGCTLAHTLAKRGLVVTVIDQQGGPAREGSGNRQAILYSRWGMNDDPLSQFNVSAYLHALRFYPETNACGVLHLAWNNEETQQQQKLQEFFAHYPEIARLVTPEEAAELAGIPVESGGLFFGQAGWIHPATVCEKLLQHPNIQSRFNTRVDHLPEDEAVVIATGHLSTHWPPTQALPLRALRGQVSHARPTPLSRQLRTVLSGDGYVAPALDDVQSFGATYTPKIHDLAVTAEEHRENREKLSRSSAALAQQWEADTSISGGRAHYRATTPDTLPLCGPVPDVATFRADYAELGRNARAIVDRKGRYLPHLYICAGLGSRGMVYAPLCAEVITSQLLGTPAPLSVELMRALSPARFVIRDLKKGTVTPSAT